MVCNACGKLIKDVYNAPDGEQYCSKDCYFWYQAMWHKVYQLIDDSPILRRESKSWGNDFKKINYFLEDNVNTIDKYMEKDFKSNSAKVRYFSSVIKNGIEDYQMPKDRKYPQCNEEFYEHKFKKKTRRKSLNDYYKEIFEDKGSVKNG